MGGRIYDPDLGRFLSPDPFIQEVGNQQNFNRYSYVLNNPLSYTDPSGFFFKSIFKLFKAAFKLVGSIVKFALTNPITQTLRTLVLGYICGPPCAAASSAFNTAINGGSLGDIIKSAAVSYASGELFIATEGLSAPGQILANGTISGVASELQGGNFFSGFISVGVSAGAGLTGIVRNISSHAGRTIASAVIGGVAAELGGGKFVNGAITGAFAYAVRNIGRSSRGLGLDDEGTGNYPYPPRGERSEELFMSRAEAAQAGLQEVTGFSDFNEVEYAGWIYQVDTVDGIRYGYTSPVTVGLPKDSHPGVPVLELGDIAAYHNHPALPGYKTGGEIFSNRDLSFGFDNYLGTARSGRIIFSPAGNRNRAGTDTGLKWR